VPDNYLLKVDNPLVVPVNKKVRIITTANDVIHAWGVPAFGVKQDAIPGFVRDTWFRSEKTGDFYGQCYELCGKEHAYMPIHVKVVSAQEYTAWVGDQQKKMAAKQDDPAKVWSSPTSSPAARRSTPPTARPATSPTARAPAHQAAGRLAHRAGRRQVQADPRGAERPQGRHARLEAAERHRHRGGHQLHQEQLVQQDRPGRPARRSAGAARQVSRGRGIKRSHP
jgi:hypothetical protein